MLGSSLASNQCYQNVERTTRPAAKPVAPAHQTDIQCIDSEQQLMLQLGEQSFSSAQVVGSMACRATPCGKFIGNCSIAILFRVIFSSCTTSLCDQPARCVATRTESLQCRYQQGASKRRLHILQGSGNRLHSALTGRRQELLVIYGRSCKWRPTGAQTTALSFLPRPRRDVWRTCTRQLHS